MCLCGFKSLKGFHTQFYNIQITGYCGSPGTLNGSFLDRISCVRSQGTHFARVLNETGVNKNWEKNRFLLSKLL